MRWLLLLLAAAAAFAAAGVVHPASSHGRQQPGRVSAAEQTTLVGPRTVVVRELPPLSPAGPDKAELRTIPRRAPRLRPAPRAEAPPARTAGGTTPQGVEPLAPPAVGTSFDGLDSADNLFGLTPPDPQIAVGPNHIVEFVNIVGRVTDKTGAPSVPDFTLASFFGVPPGSANFDPKIIYDDISDRFFASYVQINAIGDGFLRLAISASSDPTGLWYLYFARYAGAVPDYPGIGVTDDKFTISSNVFDTSFGFYLGEHTLVVQKSDVLGGGTASAVSFPLHGARFTVRPAQNLSAGSDQYLTTFDVSSFTLPLKEITVIRITGTPDTFDVVEASATNLAILPQDVPPASVTSGGGSIDSGDFRLLEAVKRGDSLWSSASAACLPGGDTVVRSCAHLIEVETAGPPSLVQDIMFGAKGQYYSWPSTRTDASSNLYVSFTGTHSGMFASAQVAGRLASDPLGTMTGSCVLKLGEIVHTSGRWGDYLGAAVDPADKNRVWVVGEYAKADGFVRWGTYIGSLSYTAGGVCPPKPPPTTTPVATPTPTPTPTDTPTATPTDTPTPTPTDTPTATPTDTPTPTLTDTPTATPTPGKPDLVLTASDSPDPIGSEDAYQYDLLVENVGPGDAHGVVVEDVLPSAQKGSLVNPVEPIEPLPDSCSFDPPAGVVRCEIGDVPASQSRQVSLAVRAPMTLAGGPDDNELLNNCATADPDDTVAEADETNNQDCEATTVLWNCPDLNGDGEVTLLDLAFVALHWRHATGADEDGDDDAGDRRADLDKSGAVGLLDLALVALHWREGCAVP